MRRLFFLLAAAMLLAAFPLTCHFAPALVEHVTGLPPAPDPAREAEQELLQDYTRRMDAIYERHGRRLTPECVAEQEQLRQATRRKIEALRRGE
jgi:hypothetical protein